MIIFESLDIGTSYLHPIHLHVIRVKFVSEGHRVKVKVTGAENIRCYPATVTYAQSKHDYNCPDSVCAHCVVEGQYVNMTMGKSTRHICAA